MSKYIIEIDDASMIFNDSKGTRLMIPAILSETEINIVTDYDLTPYDESAAEQRGAEKAWEFSQWIWQEADCFEVFGVSLSAVMDMDYKTVREKYEAWKKRKEEDAEIKVGDEVIACAACSIPFVVLSVNDIGVYGTDANGSYRGCNYTESPFEKTGRHFPEAAELLKKIGGQDG